MVRNIGKVHAQFGNWIVNSSSIKNIQENYTIYKDQLGADMDWEEHMRGKPWCDLNNFKQALKFANEFFHILTYREEIWKQEDWYRNSKGAQDLYLQIIKDLKDPNFDELNYFNRKMTSYEKRQWTKNK